MTYISTRMPERLAAGFQFAPRWKTNVTPLANGGEQRDGKWLFPKWEGRGNMGAFTAFDQELLLNMAMACRGQLHPFRVRIPTYCTAENQPLIVVAGTTRLARAHTFGSETAYKLVQAPSSVTLSGAGSVDMDTGIVTGASPGDTWSGRFDLWMRFEDDWTPFTANAMGAWTQDISLVEVRR